MNNMNVSTKIVYGNQNGRVENVNENFLNSDDFPPLNTDV